MKCWNCGTQNQKISKTCKKCGSDLTNPPEQEGNVEPVASKPEKKIHPLVWVLIGVIGLSLILLLIFAFTNNSTSVSRTGSETEPSTESAVLAEESGTTTLDESDLAGAEEGSNDDAQAAATGANTQDQGEGCDWSTCGWMDVDQCAECGGIWKDYGTEAYCNCSASKWNSLDLEWCEFEGGIWLQDEERCSFIEQSASAAGVEAVSTCSELFYNKQSDDDAAYQTFKSDCKIAGGVDHCWDEECNLQVCICPDEDNAAGSCDWVTGQAVDSSIKCYDENGTCWLTIQPSSAVAGTGESEAEPEVVLMTSEGLVFSSIRPGSDSNGCIYDDNQISCLITEDGVFNTSTVEEIYLCMDLCCLNLENMEAGNVVVQSGNCPASGNLEVWNFQLLQGVMTFEVRNNLGWDVSTLDLFLDDAKGVHWTTMSCRIDSDNDKVMNCEGWAVYKSGFATMNFYYGSGDNACSVSGVKFSIPWIDPCGTGQHYCSHTGGCCGSDYTCCSCGCKKLDDDEDCSDVCD